MACLNLPISYLTAVLLMDLFNYNEYRGLARLEGTTNQLAHGVSSQIGQGLGGLLLGVFLDLGGYIAVGDGAFVSAGRNPFLPAELHIPDGEAHVMPDGRVYLYGSLDKDSDSFCSQEYRVVSSADMLTWREECLANH